jgi:hypothetical protein
LIEIYFKYLEKVSQVDEEIAKEKEEVILLKFKEGIQFYFYFQVRRRGQ